MLTGRRGADRNPSSAGAASAFGFAESERLAPARGRRDAAASARRRRTSGRDATARSRGSRSRERALKLAPRSRARFRIAASRSRRSKSAWFASRQTSSGNLWSSKRREQGAADRETHLKQLQDDLKGAKQQAPRRAAAHLGDDQTARRDSCCSTGRRISSATSLARNVRQLEEEARTDARRRARALVADALQRVAREPHGRDDGNRGRARHRTT